MEKLKDKKEINKLALLFSLTYMVSYISRINFGAIVAEMEVATNIQKSLLSLSLTGSFITYGIGQVISGIMGDKFSPKKLVTAGFILTIIMNLLIPICNSHTQMLVIWSINGFAQALMWPPLAKIMTVRLTADDFRTTCTRVSWGSCAGTIAVYLFAPVLITWFGWKSVFIFSALCAIVMLISWNLFACDIEEEPEPKEVEQAKGGRFLFSPLMLGIMIMIILQGMLRDGVTTWMPSYVAETFNLKSSLSILTGVALPIFSIWFFQLSNELHKKVFKNPITCAGVFFGAGVVSASGLVFLGNHIWISVLCAALLIGSMQGVNLMLISMLLPFFAKFGKVSTASGVLNSCTYIGSAISTYGIAVLVEMFGWQLNLNLWLLVTAAGAALGFVLSKPWKKKYM